jgi:hypothetical protein
VEHRAQLLSGMQAFGEASLVHFYDDFVNNMELGFIKRKAADLGRSTLGKGIQVAINKLIPQLRQKDMELFAKHYGTLLVQV